MSKVFLPALRGRLGDWVYYSCLMTFDDLSKRVKTANEIHKSKSLSEFIQRQLNGSRAKEISDYIINNESRFFNSIVVAVYGGSPEWYQLDNIRSVIDTEEDIKDSISEDSLASVGFLSFSGEENLFALDGQHRLTGIKQSLKENKELRDEEISVIFVGHKNDDGGLKRTRKLFVDLNKSAKAVSKNEIIALDETDVIAITTRWLIEEDIRFNDQRILVSASAAMPTSDYSHWTNIINLYDVLELVFTKVMAHELKVPLNKSKLISNSRPSNSRLKEFSDYAQRYFTLLGQSFPELEEYFASNIPENVVKKYRKSNGGSILFRPVGLLVISLLVGEYIKFHNCSLEEAFGTIAKLPTNLSNMPYSQSVWSVNEKKMEVRKKGLLLELLKYQVNLLNSAQIEKLKKTLAMNQGIPLSEVKLPKKIG
ncbi:DGQHR domain-containing protein [Acinetobacter schindleri]|uniref:DGQHR domain-containing protein n=1 Tax=Acinetobacter schindleri TaxID=108981 RepID=UPI00404649FA